MLPNFNECWWDSIILDIFICNWFGEKAEAIFLSIYDIDILGHAYVYLRHMFLYSSVEYLLLYYTVTYIKISWCPICLVLQFHPLIPNYWELVMLLLQWFFRGQFCPSLRSNFRLLKFTVPYCPLPLSLFFCCKLIETQLIPALFGSCNFFSMSPSPFHSSSLIWKAVSFKSDCLLGQNGRICNGLAISWQLWRL